MIGLSNSYNEAVNMFKHYGIRREAIHIDDIIHLLKGGLIVINDGEYTTILEVITDDNS